MNNTEKKLDAFIEHLGLEVEETVEFDEISYRVERELWKDREEFDARLSGGLFTGSRPLPPNVSDFKTTTYKVKPKHKDNGEITQDRMKELKVGDSFSLSERRWKVTKVDKGRHISASLMGMESKTPEEEALTRELKDIVKMQKAAMQEAALTKYKE